MTGVHRLHDVLAMLDQFERIVAMADERAPLSDTETLFVDDAIRTLRVHLDLVATGLTIESIQRYVASHPKLSQRTEDLRDAQWLVPAAPVTRFSEAVAHEVHTLAIAPLPKNPSRGRPAGYGRLAHLSKDDLLALYDRHGSWMHVSLALGVGDRTVEYRRRQVGAHVAGRKARVAS